ncbi:unnamed protein product, partial [Mesorhabditis spiculigera]
MAASPSIMSAPHQGPATASLPNRPGEPEFQLGLNQTCIPFPGGRFGVPQYIDLQITNNSAERQTFKVKCTSAELFRVQPPMGMVKKGESYRVRLWFQNKTLQDLKVARHYFAIYHMRCDASVTDQMSRELWKRDAKFEGVRRLPVIFHQPQGVPPGVAGASPAAPAPPPQ